MSAFFVPQHELQAYCSPACEHASKRWNLWRHQQTYRSTENGKSKRRQQSWRRRQRARERQQQTNMLATHVEMTDLPDIPDFPILSCVVSDAKQPTEVIEPAAVLPTDAAGVENPACRCCETSTEHAESPAKKRPERPRVGHRYDPDSKKSCCLRPGCYVRFVPTSRSPLQCFCSRACRMALRRVRLREARWFRRYRARFCGPCPPAEAPD